MSPWRLLLLAFAVLCSAAGPPPKTCYARVPVKPGAARPPVAASARNVSRLPCSSPVEEAEDVRQAKLAERGESPLLASERMAEPVRAGKRLPVALRPTDDKIQRQYAPAQDPWAEADVDMQCAGSSVTSEPHGSMDSKAAEAGVHLRLGSAASQGAWTDGTQPNGLADEMVLNARGNLNVEEELRLARAAGETQRDSNVCANKREDGY